MLIVPFGCGGLAETELARQYYYTQTEDGHTLALRRYQPDKLSADKAPVILCHGLSYNLMFWDINEDVSLARYLARAGYDVWSLSLRGAAPSSQPLNSGLRKLGRFKLEPEMLNKFQGRLNDLQMTDWSVDDHMKYDLPTAIGLVQRETGYQRLHWIGHSMGGMVMFGYLQQDGAESGIKSFVAAAVPMVVFHPLSEPFDVLVKNEAALDIGSRIMGSSAPASLGSVFGDLGTPMDKLFYNGKNIDTETLKRLHYLVEEEISSGQLKQLLNMVRSERFSSLDGSIDYTSRLGQVNTPIYCLVGTVDNMATIGAVQYVFREIGSSNKQYGLFGRVNGHRNDYGHDDIIIGKHAKEEVYPRIVEWLEQFPSYADESKLMLQPQREGE